MPTTTKPRGACSECNRSFTLTKAGDVRSHGHLFERFMNCPGGGKPPQTWRDVLRGLQIHWSGTDSTTPDGCTLVVTSVVGVVTCYVIRGEQIIGRTEIHDDMQMRGYVGTHLKGGRYIGSGDSTTLQARIAEEAK